jgi:hypothetical protein
MKRLVASELENTPASSKQDFALSVTNLLSLQAFE